MTARKSARIERENLALLRKAASDLVNGDTYTFTIEHKDGSLANYIETHAYYCKAEKCNCVFKGENPQKMHK